MSVNRIEENTITDYIVCPLSGGFGLIVIVLALMIIIVIQSSQPRRKLVRYLLTCNTCCASVFYCIVQLTNYAFLIFFTSETSDTGCRWRGYFSYVSVAANAYSYFIQAVSRFMFAILSHRFHGLTTLKAHYILIAANWIAAVILPLPSITTEDIYYRPGMLCWVPLRNTLHVMYTIFSYYGIPIVLIIVIYLVIYRRVTNSRRNHTVFLNTTNEKRDLEVLRNILILLFIYLSGAIPTILFIITNDNIFYFIGIVSITFSLATEKLVTILLDKELRISFIKLLFNRRRVTPTVETTRLQKTGNGIQRF